jgi:hypothetical protein
MNKDGKDLKVWFDEWCVTTDMVDTENKDLGIWLDGKLVDYTSSGQKVSLSNLYSKQHEGDHLDAIRVYLENIGYTNEETMYLLNNMSNEILEMLLQGHEPNRFERRHSNEKWKETRYKRERNNGKRYF